MIESIKNYFYHKIIEWIEKILLSIKNYYNIIK